MNINKDNSYTLESVVSGRDDGEEIQITEEPVEPVENISNVDQVIESIEQEYQLEEELSDVELRFEEASYYRALLKNPLFKGSTSPLSFKVENEIRNFIKEKLRILVGLKSPEKTQAKSVFSDDEIKALKALASRVLGNKNSSEPVVVNQAEYKPTTFEPATVPEKIKVTRKVKVQSNKKEEEIKEQEPEIEVTLPNGMTVKTRDKRQAGQERLPKLTEQQIQDAQRNQALIDIQKNPDPFAALTNLSKKGPL